MPVQNLDNNIQIDFDIRTADTVEVEADVIIENAPTIDGTYTMPLIQMAPVITSISKNGEVLPIINKNVNIIVPTKTSDLNNDSNFVTSGELATVATSGDYNDLENTPIIPSIEGLASKTFVGNAISTHNTSEEAHQDIRDAIPSIEGLASETFVGNAVTTHNNSNDSHQDIRNLIPSVEGLASETFVGNAVSSHNTSNDSHNDIRTSISTINGKIPEQASTSNQLADKNFVNSSVATNTAYFLATLDIIDDLHLTYDATMLQVVAALNDYEFASVKTNNDYCNVITQDNVGNTVFERFKWNSQESTFKFEFALNNSSFTAVQWEAINSNATAENIAQIALNALAITSLQSDVAGKVSKSGDTMTGDLGFQRYTKIKFLSSEQSSYSYYLVNQDTQSAIDIVRTNLDGTNPIRIFRVGPTYMSGRIIYKGTSTNEDSEVLSRKEISTILESYLPLAGGTMTGDLNIDNSAGVVLFPSGSDSYRGRLKAAGAYYGFQSSANGGVSWSDALKLYVSQDKAIFQRNNIYTGQTEDEDHRLQDGADVDNKLSNYLPLVSDIQKTIVTTPPDGIVFRRNSSNGGMFIDFYSNNSTSIGWRFGSERDNNFYLGYTTNGMTSDSPKARLYTSGDLCISGNVYANGTSIAIAKKLATTEEINTPTISTSATLVGGITHLNVLGSIDYATIALPTNPGTSEYNGTFTSTTTGDITISLPLTFWQGDTDIVSGKSYSFSIQNGVGFIIQLN